MAPTRLMQKLDRDVYQIIRKFEDQELERNSNNQPKFTVEKVYDSIKRSNSSLAREKKRPLEDSIERVLRFRKEQRLEEDEDETMDDVPVESAKPKGPSYSLLNKHITKSWNLAKRDNTPSSAEGANSSTVNVTPAEVTVESSIAMADRQPSGEPRAKRRRAERPKEDRSPPTGVSLEDLGGMDDAIDQLSADVARPMLWPHIYTATKTAPARGILLHGPPGCGKTMLVNAIAAELGVAFIQVSAPSLVAGMSGESEKKIRDLYDEAKSLAPCLVFIDEIDAIMGKRDNAQKEMEKRIVAQMLTCMDDLSLEKTGGKPVITLAATNRPDSIDPALRRAGRFNKEINVGVPNEKARMQILKALSRKPEMADDINWELLAKMTPGFVGADLEDVISTASSIMLNRTTTPLIQQATSQLMVDMDTNRGFGETKSQPLSAVQRMRAMKSVSEESILRGCLMITQEDLVAAISMVQPSAKREGFTTIPDTLWSHVGALDNVRKELRMAIVQHIADPERYAKLGWSTPSGVLLWGPPGCGKTLVAKAVANEAKANFISIKGPELLNKYVGESERLVRQVFARARSSAPCILFFDEMDALVPPRSDSIAESSARVVNMLLAEMDGINSRAGVYVIGATNRPDMIDPAMTRPGRLGTRIYVDLPDSDGRADILKALVRKSIPGTTEAELFVLDGVARDKRCEGFSGADLQNLHVAAAKAAVERQDVEGTEEGIIPCDWELALGQTKPSVSDTQYRKFIGLKDNGWD